MPVARHRSKCSHELCRPFSVRSRQSPARSCLLRATAPPGFRNLSTPRAGSRPGLFHPGAAHGVSPSRAIRAPPVASRPAPPLLSFEPPRLLATAPAFRGSFDARLRPKRARVTAPARPTLSWVLASPGFSSVRDGADLFPRVATRRGPRGRAPSVPSLSRFPPRLPRVAAIRAWPGAPGPSSSNGPACLLRALPTLLRFSSSSPRLPLRTPAGLAHGFAASAAWRLRHR